MNAQETFLKNIAWRCPACTAVFLVVEEGGLVCTACHRVYTARPGVYNFLTDKILYDEKSNGLRDFFKRWPRFYYAVVVIFGPVFFMGLGPRAFLKKYGCVKPVFNVGSGPRTITPEVINIDIFPYAGVSIVADSAHLPLPNDSAGGIICADVLEHVSNPEEVVAELGRVLRPGCYAYLSIPFLYPFHASPHDFNRWTGPGLDRLFSNFSIIEKGVRSGPFSALTVNLCYLVATIFSFGNKKVYWLLVNLATFIFFPIKYLDFIFGRFPFALNMAAEVYYVIQKK